MRTEESKSEESRGEQSRGGHQRRRGAEQRSEAKQQEHQRNKRKWTAERRQQHTTERTQKGRNSTNTRHETRKHTQRQDLQKNVHFRAVLRLWESFSCGLGFSAFFSLLTVFFVVPFFCQGAGRRAERHLLRENALGSLRIIT